MANQSQFQNPSIFFINYQYIFDFIILQQSIRTMGTNHSSDQVAKEAAPTQQKPKDNKQTTNSTQAPHSEFKFFSRSPQQSQKFNDFRTIQANKLSLKNNVVIETQNLYVTGQNGKRYDIGIEVITVPFEVITATMDVDLLAALKQLAPKIKEQYQIADRAIDKPWKLQGNGFYINYDLGHAVCIITSDTIYRGVVIVNKNRQFVPEQKGILIKTAGMYQGQFRNGKAHGQGTYTMRKTLIKFIGEWQNGVMVNGQIQSDSFKFKGLFKNLLAEGPGAIKFIKSGNSYVGNFSKGKYNSIVNTTQLDKQGVYETANYVYQGHFTDGLKHGAGILKQKKNQPKTNKKGKYRPPDDYDGQWIEDYFVTTRLEREEKKIRQQNIYQEIGQRILLVGDLDKKNNKSQKTSDFSDINIKIKQGLDHQLLNTKLARAQTVEQIPQFVDQEEIKSQL